MPQFTKRQRERFLKPLMWGLEEGEDDEGYHFFKCPYCTSNWSNCPHGGCSEDSCECLIFSGDLENYFRYQPTLEVLEPVQDLMMHLRDYGVDFSSFLEGLEYWQNLVKGETAFDVLLYRDRRVRWTTFDFGSWSHGDWYFFFADKRHHLALNNELERVKIRLEACEVQLVSEGRLEPMARSPLGGCSYQHGRMRLAAITAVFLPGFEFPD